jgi:hypothetical protein
MNARVISDKQVHDVNNLLTVIIGQSDLLVNSINGNEELLRRLRQIRLAAQDAAHVLRHPEGETSLGNPPYQAGNKASSD